ncbi:conserved hypothetical protein [Ricinus communis]|uniref:Uncharacterized protein n=1 Tax=Ricinus communis TaxID=3988 RepID=B9SQG3_RICCO|nr:conserved hypothetical protein [Ricinus communis]
MESQASMWKEMSDITEGLRHLPSQTRKKSIEEANVDGKKQKGKAYEVEHLVSSTEEEKHEKKIKLEMVKPGEDEEKEKGAKSTKVSKTTRQSKKA